MQCTAAKRKDVLAFTSRERKKMVDELEAEFEKEFRVKCVLQYLQSFSIKSMG